MQLVLSEDVDDDEGFGEEDGRFNEDDWLVATVTTYNNSKMDTLSPSFLFP
jgi:hypothetical protein